MNKKILLAVLLLAILGASAYFIWQGKLKKREATGISKQTEDSLKNAEMITVVDTTSLTAQHKNITPTNLKTYTNTKLGFSFQYPPKWLMAGKEVEMANLKGSITSVEINFIDTLSPTTLLVACHLTRGGELYQYAVSQFKLKQGWYAKDGKEIEVAGNKAIEANLISAIDGRGNKLTMPTKTVIVDLLNKKQSIEIQLQFKTPLSNEEAGVAEFNRILAGFKFTD